LPAVAGPQAVVTAGLLIVGTFGRLTPPLRDVVRSKPLTWTIRALATVGFVAATVALVRDAADIL
jgi:hypothetical protein